MAPLGVLLSGVVFLAFDRRREVRCRIAEVIDSRPIPNLALISGRYLALLAAASFVLLLTAVTIQAFGSAAVAFDWRIGEMIEPVSLFAFVFVDALPALAVWCALTVLLTVALPNRVLVLLIATGLLVGQYWLLHNVPIQFLPAVSLLPSFGTLASDILPELPDAAVFWQRFCLVPLIGALLIGASTVVQRMDGHPSRLPGSMAAILAVVGVLGLVALLVRSTDGATLRADWRAAHQIVDSMPRADIDHIKGRVRIDPGDGLSLDIDMLSTPLTDPPPEELVFSLNPGLQLHHVLIDGESAEYRHESGLLVVEPRRRLHPAREFVLSVVAEGIPDPGFAYLDSSVEPLAKSWSESRLAFLGTRASVFDNAFVALMPGTRWLPTPGPNLARSTGGPLDFFTVDLEIEVPAGWRIAAPGVGQPTDCPSRVRFAPREALREVTAVTAPFERFAVQVGNAEFELLLHSDHLRNVEWPDDMEQAMVQLLAEFVEDAEDFGIPFPYGGLSVVEVPAQLRIYGGGHRMHSVQNNAGVLLMREHGFPTARFDRVLSWDAPAVSPIYQFWGYFDRDRTGGNLLAGATDNLVRFVTAQGGDNADAAESLVAHLTSRLFRIRRSSFSAHAFVDSELSGTGPSAPRTPATRLAAIATGVVSRIVEEAGWDALHPSLWFRATNSTWSELSVEDDRHHALATMSLKTNALGVALVDLHGPRAIGDILAAVRSRYEGRSFTMEDIRSVAAEVGTPLDPIIDDWLSADSAPGFVSSVPEIRVVPDDGSGRVHLTTVHVRNERAARGMVRLEIGTDRGDGAAALNHQRSAPVPVPGNSSVEIGMLSAAPPLEAWLLTYLSLNGSEMRPQMAESRNGHPWSGDTPFVGVRPSFWHPPDETAITVDDLDPGFSVESSRPQGLLRRLPGFAQGDRDIHLDHGIPVFYELPGLTSGASVQSSWSRQGFTSAWGRYRQTLARAPSGDGIESAVFAARLPTTGRWTLEYHLPDLSPRSTRIYGVWSGGSLGTFDLTLAAHGESTGLEFDAGRAVAGWNPVGTFMLKSGRVRLIVSGRSTGETVIADAIRWRRQET
ncbi:MAG: hypothetical protein OXH09_00075 [Gammaproteobacteria bacterium]|nr:hypothetical protein [Gammaproteobacteria bacterium]